VIALMPQTPKSSLLGDSPTPRFGTSVALCVPTQCTCSMFVPHCYPDSRIRQGPCKSRPISLMNIDAKLQKILANIIQWDIGKIIYYDQWDLSLGYKDGWYRSVSVIYHINRMSYKMILSSQ
jgi:hypothetical protein